MQARLLVLHDKANIKHVKLLPVTLIGRSTECNLKIASSQVSRNHCRITVNQDTVCVEDLGSANGTLINGQPIEPNKVIPVTPGTRLTVGPAEFQFDFATNTAATVVLPSTRVKPQSLLPGTEVIPPTGDDFADTVSPATAPAQRPVLPQRPLVDDTRVEVPQSATLDGDESDNETLDFQAGAEQTTTIPPIIPATPLPVPEVAAAPKITVAEKAVTATAPAATVVPVAAAVAATAIPVAKAVSAVVKPAATAKVAQAVPVKARPVAEAAAPVVAPVAPPSVPPVPSIATFEAPEPGFAVAQQENENPFDFFSEAPAEGLAVEEGVGEDSPFQFDAPTGGGTSTAGASSSTPKKGGLKSLFSLFGKKPAQAGKPSKSSSSLETSTEEDSPFGGDPAPASVDVPFMGFGASEETPAAVELPRVEIPDVGIPGIEAAVPVSPEPEPTPPAEAAEPDPFQDFLGKL